MHRHKSVQLFRKPSKRCCQLRQPSLPITSGFDPTNVVGDVDTHIFNLSVPFPVLRTLSSEPHGREGFPVQDIHLKFHYSLLCPHEPARQMVSKFIRSKSHIFQGTALTNSYHQHPSRFPLLQSRHLSDFGLHAVLITPDHVPHSQPPT